MNTLECIKTRHSTRKFKADQLSRELIDQVLDAGRRAPSGGNTQINTFHGYHEPRCAKRTSNTRSGRIRQNADYRNTLPYMVNIIKCPLKASLYLTMERLYSSYWLANQVMPTTLLTCHVQCKT